MKNALSTVLAAMLQKLPGVVVGKKFDSANSTVRKKVFAFSKDGGVALKLPPETVKTLVKTRTASLLVMGKPYDARLMRCYPVSTRINNVANDDEQCSHRVGILDPQTELFP